MSATWVIAVVGPALVAIMAIAILRRTALAERISDRPNARSLHSTPTPRLGGLGMAVAVLPVAMACADSLTGTLLVCAAALVLVSFADDLRSLPILVRLSAHFAAAAVAVWTIAPAIPVALAALAVIAIVWCANLYNFMDGADGLAGGMTAIGFGALAWAAHGAGAESLALVCGAIACAAAGFLVFNFPPARVFMGDAGSVPLGFLAGAFGLYGWSIAAWPAWFAAVVFAPFIADATVTIARRALRRERIWEAHRSHYYQRLVLSGWSPRRLALSAWALMLACALAAAVALRAGEMVQCAIILGLLVAFAIAFVAIDVRLARGRVSNNNNSHRMP
ncbi:MraY family glycosyltransferase [Usitatibacter palustris]|uniref:Putative undecaprenyl-phosphate N-acetylglucosaminyl 1-phosphate transferase n=1 Tax=Usitatibacter palustris TaxID=2732487 RepID=A0A6M4HDU8_9PROT|nr:glycosyltransferase family 4 protein [Usitatibacter palustris]QJR16918.1 putative undecaprenyl-phosphate N-acetylglucosaminyl 1-phosphate transferase [Usitatibacter palustris]